MGVKINGTNSSVTLTAEADAGGYDVEIPKAGVGKVLQVQSTTSDVGFSTTSATLVDTGIEVTITPKSVNSKILITGVAAMGNWQHELSGVGLRRDSTDIGLGDGLGSRVAVHSAGVAVSDNTFHSTVLNFLDTPNTLLPVTYKITIQARSGYTTRINRTGGDLDDVYTVRPVSTITVMEIGE